MINWLKRVWLELRYSTFKFEKVGKILIVQVPVGKLPPHKAEEHLKYYLELFSKCKSEFDVDKIIVVGYID